MSGYLDGTGAAGFVVGVSGGIDSAVVSTLAAMTGRRTLCVTLPIHQVQAQVDRAGEHVRRLTERYSNAEAAHADLTAAYDAFAGSFAPSLVQGAGKGVADLAGANARSRLRMTALYYFAGLNNLLVVGTGNKIEDFGVGFFTKYGDGGVDISPIADLTKTEVYELGAGWGFLRRFSLRRRRTAFSVTSRTDEQQIGATYPTGAGDGSCGAGYRPGTPVGPRARSVRHFPPTQPCQPPQDGADTGMSHSPAPGGAGRAIEKHVPAGAEGVGVGVHAQGCSFNKITL